MRSLNPPGFNARRAIEACVEGISDLQRAEALREAEPVIVRAEQEYMMLGAAGNLYQMAPTSDVTPDLDANLMSLIYKRNFVRLGSPARPMYEQIRMAPEFGICPLCGQRIVATVDHYLPQSRYPKLTLAPINLVPACADCNKAKLARMPQVAEEQLLHPYFDDLGHERWLLAEILQTVPPATFFSIRAATSWSTVLAARVRHHFMMMGLAELYASQAASELADISHALIEVGDAAGADGLQAHLDREARSRLCRNRNSWQTALYEALAGSEWFCREGYRLSAPVRF